MNKDKVVNFTGSIIIFFILLFVYSKWGPSVPISVLTQTKGEPMVVTGTGKVSVVPDIAKVTVGIESSGSSLKQVQDSLDLKSKKLIDEIKKLGIKEGDIKTINYNIYPEYDYTTTPQRINGYRVSTSYEIKITDFEKVNNVLTVSTSAGANTVGGITLEVNDNTKKEKLQEAREQAVTEAKQKAQGLAKASGIPLGKIINITESNDTSYPRPLMAYDKTVGLGGGVNQAAPEANIQPGQSEIQVNVSISFEIR